ncbi:hypothetical protein ADK55_17665 [Streptomyces sp. WM4235]|uniref:DUF3618 domain-containing protein n=1 Tax=Streptomyces sp. WM4235 TaxID=1415551 RepID=UPI0006AE5779|nr:DUF3618 domain-containing protein [Streptomyces sp. WM4235]KOU52091.1 hypothetical protein ADK55_17665 [Streptomyces sp. WM4235]
MSDDHTHADKDPATPDELREQIEATRDELGRTVEALAAKADVKARAQDKTAEVKAEAREKAAEVKAGAHDKAAEVKARAHDKAVEVKAGAQEKVSAVVHAAQDRIPEPVAQKAASLTGAVEAGIRDVTPERGRAEASRAAEVARRHPALVAAGCAVLAYGLVRRYRGRQGK